MLTGVQGDISSKRMITVCAFLLVSLAFLVNIFMAIPLQEFVFNGMLYLTGAGLGFSAFEKFSPASKKDLNHHEFEPSSVQEETNL